MRRIIIDTDTGSDDAVAMLIALLDKNIKVEAVTTVAGNVGLEQATVNALITIEMAGTYKPPVYKGLGYPIASKLPQELAFMVHGQDGMGDIGYPAPTQQPEKEHAVDALIRIIEANPGELELVTLGPTSNIGLLIMQAPQTVLKLKKIVVMGGAFMETGEWWVPPAESNIRNDVESANLIANCGVPVVFVPINACRGEIVTTEEDIALLMSGGDVAKFSVECNRTLMGFNKQRWGREIIDPADPVAMAVATYPECVEHELECYTVFETDGELTRGVMVYDYNGMLEQEPNSKVVVKVDAQKYKDYVYGLLMGAS